MSDNKYNGWTNYETWNVKLWMDNDEFNYNYWREITRGIMRTAVSKYDWQTDEQQARYELSEYLKEYYEDNNPLIDGASTYNDLLGAALSEVNWYEIAESLMDDAIEEAA